MNIFPSSYIIRKILFELFWLKKQRFANLRPAVQIIRLAAAAPLCLESARNLSFLPELGG